MVDTWSVANVVVLVVRSGKQVAQASKPRLVYRILLSQYPYRLFFFLFFLEARANRDCRTQSVGVVAAVLRVYTAWSQADSATVAGTVLAGAESVRHCSSLFWITMPNSSSKAKSQPKEHFCCASTDYYPPCSGTVDAEVKVFSAEKLKSVKGFLIGKEQNAALHVFFFPIFREYLSLSFLTSWFIGVISPPASSSIKCCVS